MAKTQYPIDGVVGKEYKVTSPFGWRQHPTDPTKRKHHNGVDLWGAANVIYIEAFHDGKVVFAGPSKSKKADGSLGGFGYYVQILHTINGKQYVSLYAHMVKDSLQVKVGQKVTAGTVLGKMGATGDVTGKHLHFEICAGKTYVWSADGKGFVDPIKFIKTVIAAEAVVAEAPNPTPAESPTAPVAAHEPVAPVEKKAPVVAAAPVELVAAKPVAKVVPANIYKEPFNPKLRNDEFGNMAPYRSHPHRGQDWSPKDQSPIAAVCAGKVSNVFWTDVLGWVVEIYNPLDKVFTQYCHLAPTNPKAPKSGSSATVKKGDMVKLGQIIGKVGGSKATSPSGSASTGAHLHMGMSKKQNGHMAAYNQLIDPLKWILAHKAK
jgi:murein DD-endopeptidase MepM/ murein hydrolase activator NlpD